MEKFKPHPAIPNPDKIKQLREDWEKVRRGGVTPLYPPVSFDAWQHMIDNYGTFDVQINDRLNQQLMNNMKKNFPIGAKVYVNDNSYIMNMSTRQHERLALKESLPDHTTRYAGPLCEVISTPFKSKPQDLAAGQYVGMDLEFVLVRPVGVDGQIGSSDIYMVLNDLSDGIKRVQLNNQHVAEIHEKQRTVTVGCQSISFDKVAELYQVIFQGRQPEAISPAKQMRVRDSILAHLHMP